MYAYHPGFVLALTVVLLSLLLHLVFLIIRAFTRIQRSSPPTIAFLHPACLSGGGGERVLWVALSAVHSALPLARIVLLAPWPESSDSNSLLQSTRDRVSAQFHVPIPDFVPIRVRTAVLADAAAYPFLTLALQALGQAVLGLEAVLRSRPDVLVDTANQAFSLAPASALGIVTVSYVHYPTVSADMLEAVRSRKGAFNNDRRIARSRALSEAKLHYYRGFARVYGAVGRAIDVSMVNSSWTKRHISQVWNLPERRVDVVFPPCDTGLLEALPARSSARTRGLFVSVGQFRPEKDHMTQLRVMAALMEEGGVYQKALKRAGVRPRLIMVGGARGPKDIARVRRLQEERAKLGLDGVVEMKVNASWEDLVDILSTASAGLHTMRDEHFGISVVELQAAGVLPVAHNSGGVAIDIIDHGVTGFLADDVPGYCDGVVKVLSGENLKYTVEEMQQNARKSVARFQDIAFALKFCVSVKLAAAEAESRGSSTFL